MIGTIHEVIHKVANDDPQTTEVVLKGVVLQSDLFTALAMALISNTHVKTLYLVSVNVYSYSSQILASALAQNSSLETVWLEDNQMCSNGASALATALYINTSITTFGLRNNLVGNEGEIPTHSGELNVKAHKDNIFPFIDINRSFAYSQCTAG